MAILLGVVFMLLAVEVALSHLLLRRYLAVELPKVREAAAKEYERVRRRIERTVEEQDRDEIVRSFENNDGWDTSGEDDWQGREGQPVR